MPLGAGVSVLPLRKRAICFDRRNIKPARDGIDLCASVPASSKDIDAGL